MSVLLYLLGILSVIGGVAGIPVKEFSFGNTLILSGTAGLVGGLIIIGLAAAISHLQRIGEMLGARPLSKAGRLEPFEAPAKIPFPPKPKTQPRQTATLEPSPAVSVAEEPKREPDFAAPSLRNPDVPLMAEEEAQELPLSPRNTEAAAEAAARMPGDTRVEALDLASQTSVRAFAERWVGHLDLLVNTAAVRPWVFRQDVAGR